ncbi:hypothetical protein Tco_0933572 [Tanacetum coccineum]
MAFVPKHNQVGFLKKPEGSAGFEQIVDFLKGTHIRYALEHNPTIYVSVIKQFWQTVTVITLDNGEQELKATIDTHEYTISESSVRNKLKLADENGITEFTNAEIFEGMANLGFLSMVLEAKPVNTNLYLAYQLTKKIFGNMNRGFAGVYRPLLANMIAGHDENQGEPQEELLNHNPPNAFDSREADISPSGSQAAETLVQVASQKTKTYTRKVKSGLKKKLDVGVSSGDRKFKSASEEIKSGFTNLSFGEVRVSQRKGKEVLEEQPQPKRSKKQIREEEASLAEIARIQAQEAAEIERKAELQRLDELAAKRLNDEFEMPEQQRKSAAEVQQQAQYYTEEVWDLIRARMEASTELRKSVFGSDIDAEDYAKKMVELVEKRRREIREQKLKAKKNKPMTQAEQRNYMMNYVRSQSHGWTIPQLKKLSFEELKVQFKRTIRSIENFIPMDSEIEKESLKRSGETLQGAEKKKQKVLDVEDIPIPESAKFVKEEEIEVKQPVLKMSRRKSKARKGIGLHTSTEPESGEVDITSSKIVKWKILRHGGKGYCHLIRANQRDSVFVNFRAMLHNISRDDLVDLYKIMLQKTTAYGPKEDLESAFAENLRIMFDPPQSEDISCGVYLCTLL